jgi:hypothetical protein
MSPVASEIVHAYPTLEVEIHTLSYERASDSRLLAELASHVVDLFQAGHPEEVSPAFGLAERLLVSGQEANMQAATVGFLETIQNVASHRSCGASAFERFLGPQSRKAWAELIQVVETQVEFGGSSCRRDRGSTPAALVAILAKTRQTRAAGLTERG